MSTLQTTDIVVAIDKAEPIWGVGAKMLKLSLAIETGVVCSHRSKEPALTQKPLLISPHPIRHDFTWVQPIEAYQKPRSSIHLLRNKVE